MTLITSLLVFLLTLYITPSYAECPYSFRLRPKWLLAFVAMFIGRVTRLRRYS
jgi:hypothetical protein